MVRHRERRLGRAHPYLSGMRLRALLVTAAAELADSAVCTPFAERPKRICVTVAPSRDPEIMGERGRDYRERTNMGAHKCADHASFSIVVP
jgi:hypothetical protein